MKDERQHRKREREREKMSISNRGLEYGQVKTISALRIYNEYELGGITLSTLAAQIRPFISPSVVLLKCISKWIWWTWRKNISSILLKKPEGNSRWCAEAEHQRIEMVKRENGALRVQHLVAGGGGEKSKSISGLTFALQKMVNWHSPSHNINRSPAEQNHHVFSLLSSNRRHECNSD